MPAEDVMTELIDRINALKRQRNAVIYAHLYQRGEVQDIADMVGDSLELARAAAKSDAAVIVLCGVYFMAESAALLAPARTVLIPDANAGCPMANMVTPRELREWKQQHPGAMLVCYVNSSAAVKAECDICCTSANAAAVVKSLPADAEIMFLPDQSLGDWVNRQTGRNMRLWPGFCPTHHRILARDIDERRREYPEAMVLAHPECTLEVVDRADVVTSTAGMIRHVRGSDRRQFIIATELGLMHRLRADFPDRTFIHATPLADCANMKLVTLEKILWSLEDMATVVTVPEAVAARARKTLEKMVGIG